MEILLESDTAQQLLHESKNEETSDSNKSETASESSQKKGN